MEKYHRSDFLHLFTIQYASCMDDRNLYSKHDPVKWKTYTSTMDSGKSNTKMIKSEDLIMKSSNSN